ncbi:MAG: HAMP domain-containing histidine kinase [Cyclobacteriaceae bacterium]|nr:HAMP domain-containing histidine kinase [Cyclobacteriaceae bacterium]
MRFFNSISKRLFLALSIVFITVIGISILSYQFNLKNKKLFALVNQLESQRVNALALVKNDLDFLRFETINTTFYLNKQSFHTLRHDTLMQQVLTQHNLLKNKLLVLSQDLATEMKTAEVQLLQYDTLFSNFKELQLKRGFKDYGLEGKMRKYAHELENHSEDISMVDVLTLRRHEKDFFLRKESIYQNKFNQLINSILTYLKTKKNYNPYTIYLLTAYKQYFNELANIDIQLGQGANQGLTGKLNQQAQLFSATIENTVVMANTKAEEVIRQSLYSSILIGTCLFLFTGTLTFFTASSLTVPIKKLSFLMSKYFIRQSIREKDLPNHYHISEIQNLSESFLLLTKKLKAQFADTEKKSQLIEKRNQELQQLNEELDRFIYSSAHDLKSPLASIEGLLYLFKIDNKDENLNHYFDKMKKSLDRMNGFIKDITDYAKNKRQHIQPEIINLSYQIKEITDALQFLPEMKNINIEIDIDETNNFVTTDKTRLEIILKNIISNAIKYHDPQKEQSLVRIRLCAETASDVCEPLASQVAAFKANHTSKNCSAFGLGPAGVSIPGCGNSTGSSTTSSTSTSKGTSSAPLPNNIWKPNTFTISKFVLMIMCATYVIM